MIQLIQQILTSKSDTPNQFIIPSSLIMPNKILPKIHSNHNKEKKTQLRRETHPTGNNNAGDHREKGDVGEPSLPFSSHQIGKHCREERRGSSNRLVE